MSRYRFYIDGTEILQEPRGWDDFEIVIDRDDTNRIIAVKAPLELTFFADGYARLKQLKQQNGRNYIATFRADELDKFGYNTIFQGSINLTEGTDDILRKMWEVPVKDGNYSAYIFNNLELSIDVSLSETKNGQAITPPTPVALSIPITGYKQGIDSISYDTRSTWNAYDVKDLFEYAIGFVSDNNLSFTSSWYDGLANDEKICVIAADEAVYRNGAPLVFTMKDLINSVARVYNLYLSVSGTTIILEDYDYFLNNGVSATFTQFDTLELAFDPNSSYKEIKVGDPAEKATNFPNGKRYFAPQLFYQKNEANSSAVLDIQPAFSVNANLIPDSFVDTAFGLIGSSHATAEAYGGRDIDSIYQVDGVPEGWFIEVGEKPIMVQYNSSTNTAVRSTVETRFYSLNEQMFNENILSRYYFNSDVYYQPKDGNSFTMRMKEDTFSVIDTNTELPVLFNNINGEAAFTTTNGEFLDDDPLYPSHYIAPSGETKTFRISALIPKFHTDRQSVFGELGYTNPVLVENTKVNVLNLKKTEVGILYATTSNPCVLFLNDEDAYQVGDSIFVEFINRDALVPASTDWSSASSLYTVQAQGDRVISINLDSSGFDINEFVGGGISIEEPGAVSLTNVDIEFKIVRENSSGTIVQTETILHEDVYSDVVYSHSATLTLNAGDKVYPKIEIIASENESDVLFLPVEWSGSNSEAEIAVSANIGGFRGEIINAKTVATKAQRNSILKEPFKAIGIQDGKGWPKRVALNIVTGDVNMELLTNSTFYDAAD